MKYEISNIQSVPMEKKNIYDILSKSPLFKGLTHLEIEEIFFHVKYRLFQLKKNEIYILEGSDHYFADIVLQGEITSFMVGASGKSFMIHRFAPGILIAPAFIFKSHSIPVTVKANGPSILIRINPEDLMHLIDINSTIRHNFISILSNMVVNLTQKIRQLEMKTTKEKVVEYLRMQAKESDDNNINIIGTRQDIADLIGVQRYSLVRCLDQLQKQGIIKVERKKITVLDMRSLREI